MSSSHNNQLPTDQDTSVAQTVTEIVDTLHGINQTPLNVHYQLQYCCFDETGETELGFTITRPALFSTTSVFGADVSEARARTFLASLVQTCGAEYAHQLRQRLSAEILRITLQVRIASITDGDVEIVEQLPSEAKDGMLVQSVYSTEQACITLRSTTPGQVERTPSPVDDDEIDLNTLEYLLRGSVGSETQECQATGAVRTSTDGMGLA